MAGGLRGGKPTPISTSGGWPRLALVVRPHVPVHGGVSHPPSLRTLNGWCDGVTLREAHEGRKEVACAHEEDMTVHKSISAKKGKTP